MVVRMFGIEHEAVDYLDKSIVAAAVGVGAEARIDEEELHLGLYVAEIDLEVGDGTRVDCIVGIVFEFDWKNCMVVVRLDKSCSFS